MRRAIVIMGVSGSGKSAVGAELAVRLGLRFVDADTLHDAAAVEKMRRGVALSDEDRWPWLDRVGAVLAGRGADGGEAGVVVACSALRRAYRDRLRGHCPGLGFVFLDGPAEVIETRMQARQGHYMPASLLASQLQTLERPAADETDIACVDLARPLPRVVEDAARKMNELIGPRTP